MADAYLLYFFAARGHGGGLIGAGVPGRSGHPRSANSVFENADYTQAHKWYQMAVQRATRGARDRLADLHAASNDGRRRRRPGATHFALMAVTMNRLIPALMALTVALGPLAWASSHAADQPLLIPGQEGLYQRVLAVPGARAAMNRAAAQEPR